MSTVLPFVGPPPGGAGLEGRRRRQPASSSGPGLVGRHIPLDDTHGRHAGDEQAAASAAAQPTLCVVDVLPPVRCDP